MRLFKLTQAVILLASFLIFAQDDNSIIKTWRGTLTAGNAELKIVVHITRTDDGNLAAAMDSPNQGVKGIPAVNVVVENGKIKFEVPSVMGHYEGDVKGDFSSIQGEWSQSGQSFPLTLYPDSEEQQDLDFFSIWEGSLKFNASGLRLIFRFYKTGNDSIGAFLDSPDQGAEGIPATDVYYGDDSIYVGVKSINGFYSGKFNDDKTKIEGEWKQSGSAFPLELSRIEKVEEARRPQEPKAPFPYKEEEVTFVNSEAGLTLAGTFTFPDEGKKFPAVVLITGSGSQNRDEELLGHKPFLVWSDHLTRNGIAVLRFDDRGVGKSTGNFQTATTADFATDVLAAVDYLKSREEVDKNNIGLIGHSEGGIIAPIAANKSEDISFIILVAGPAVPGNEILLLQSKLISEGMGISKEDVEDYYNLYEKTYKIIIEAEDSVEMDRKLVELYEEEISKLSDEERNKPENSREQMERGKKMILHPWFRYFVKYNPRPAIEKLKVPVLAVYGEKDLQVPASQNEPEMKKALEKSSSKNFEVVTIPGLNHLMQEAETGLPAEYIKIEQTTSPRLLEMMTLWIKEVID